MTDTDVRDLVLDRRLGRLAAELAGVDGMRIWLDQALIKEPWSSPTAFHVDNPFWSFRRFDVYPELGSSAPVFCPVPAGSAVAHNGLTAHGAGANMTNGRRFAMTVAYMPDGATFNGQQDILTREQVARLKVGDPLDDEAQNPLVFTRSPAR
ncbi:MAG TPA: phytanoyl-CoA dioxygenase family protein [Trebonia sp.]|jgi:phytanoyl-CoA hydroxylase|nr:phytanoyl-CoA dioxygenase family protein [Trebonia sp.]